MPESWTPAGPDVDAVLARYDDPLRVLSEAEVPAILLHRVYRRADCDGLIERFIERDLMRHPDTPAVEGERTRIDVGTSLGNRGGDQAGFFDHAAATHSLFQHLFDGFDNPVDKVYGHLSQLAAGRQVKVAREPDGRLYGPAVFRIHYGGHAYSPHIDHVSLREKRFDYAVTRFEHQFAGVLCLRNSSQGDGNTQAILHRCLWTEEVQPHLAAGTFPRYAATHNVEHCSVALDPGDLYFFNTRLIHEVPAVQGREPRVVLAVFMGFTSSDDEIFVWA